MKPDIGSLKRRWTQPLMMTAGFLPVPVLLCAWNLPEAPLRGLPVALLYVCAAWICAAVPGRRRLIAGGLGTVAIAALGMLLLPWRTAPVLLAIPLVFAVLLAAGLAHSSEMPLAYPCIGLGLHVAAQFAQLFDAEAANAAVYVLRGAFVVYAFLALLSMNRASLRDAAAKGSPAPLSVRRKNRLLAVALGLVTLLIACLPAILQLFERLWSTLIAAIGRFLAWLGNLFAVEMSPDTGGGGGAMDMMGAASAEPSPFWEILEKIVLVIGIATAAALAVIAVRLLWQKSRRMFAALLRRLRQFVQAASEDYQDEISDTREGGERKRLFRKFVRKPDPLKGIDAAKLPPRERVRFYYLRARLKHPGWAAEQTAREHLPADAVEIYERARYSAHEVRESDASRFQEKVK